MDFVDSKKIPQFEKDSLIRGKVLAIFNGLEILIKFKIAKFFFIETKDQERFTKIVLDEGTVNYSTLVHILIKCSTIKYDAQELRDFEVKLIQVGKLRNKIVHGYITYYYDQGEIRSTYINHNSEIHDFNQKFDEFNSLTDILIHKLLLD